MTPRQKLRYTRLFFGVMFLGLGIWVLADAEYLMGAFWVLASAFWSLAGVFEWWTPNHVGSQSDT